LGDQTLVRAVVVVPLVAALLSGVAGQPQSYFYLLPAVLVSASAWAIDPCQQVRRVGAILFVVGLVVLGTGKETT